jgi:hypothetical protein
VRSEESTLDMNGNAGMPYDKPHFFTFDSLHCKVSGVSRALLSARKYTKDDGGREPSPLKLGRCQMNCG